MALYVETIENNNLIIFLVHKRHHGEFIRRECVVGEVQATVIIKNIDKAVDTCATDQWTRDDVLEETVVDVQLGELNNEDTRCVFAGLQHGNTIENQWIQRDLISW